MTETIAIVDYGSGNLRSVEKAFEVAVRDTGLSADVRLSADPSVIATADRIVLPGVGAFRACREGLDAEDGMVDALTLAVIERARPFLGICVGMQLLATKGLEFGETPGLGWIAGRVRALAPDTPSARLPHIGWNAVSASLDHPLSAPLSAPISGPISGAGTTLASAPDRSPVADGANLYFANSFCFEVENKEHVIAACDHSGAFTAAIARDNIAGFQFHPEKSQRAGLRLIEAFLRWRP